MITIQDIQRTQRNKNKATKKQASRLINGIVKETDSSEKKKCKYMKKSASLSIIVIQIKNAPTFHHIPVRIAITKKTNDNKCSHRCK